MTVGGALVAVVGLGLVLDLVGNVGVDPVGVLWGFGAAVGLAVFFVLSAGTADAPPPLVVAWAGLVVGGATLLVAGVVGALPLAAPRTDVTLLDARVSWLVPVVGLAVIGAAVAYVSGVVAARFLGAKMASFVGLTEVLFAVAFTWLLLGQVLVPAQLLGGVLVIAGIALVRVDEMRPTEVEPAVAARPAPR